MTDALRRILYHGFVVTIIATLWAMGVAQAMSEQAYGHRRPPALHRGPVKFERADAHRGGAGPMADSAWTAPVDPDCDGF
jgi:hypothetical protein